MIPARGEFGALRRHSRFSRRHTCVAALAALLPLGFVGALSAQTPDPVLRLTEPQEWRAGATLTAAQGASIRVRGVASHPGGVDRVLVNGGEATLRPDPEFPELVNFEVVITAREPGDVVMRIVPRTGAPFERSFVLQLTGARPQATPARAQAPSSPWKGFRIRGVLYGVAAVGGVVLGMQEKSETSESCRQVTGGFDCFLRTETTVPNQTAGFALAGVAVGGLILDAILTSRRARAAGSGGPGQDEDAPSGPHLDFPALEAGDDHVRVNWIRLRF